MTNRALYTIIYTFMGERHRALQDFHDMESAKALLAEFKDAGVQAWIERVR